MTNKTIIFDLDDTIFQTKSIHKKTIDPFFEHLSENLQPLYQQEQILCIMDDLWKYSWDVVLDSYKIPKDVFVRSIKILETLPLDLKISPYPDYQFLKNLKADKFLVTTGLTHLQEAKINALNIKNDFNKIFINDRLIEPKTKLDIFKEIIDNYSLVPSKTFVVGDNPHAEIEAGNSLNLTTIQILRNGAVKGNNARHYIHSFEELKHIIQ